MSDVILAAVIAGTVGLMGSFATLAVTRLNITDQARQREKERQAAAHQDRQKKYGDLAWQLGRLHKYGAWGFPPSHENWTDWLDWYAFTRSVALIAATPAVREGIKAFDAVLQNAAADFRRVEQAPGLWTEAYQRHHDEIEAAIQDLTERMGGDVYGARELEDRRGAGSGA